MYEELVKRLREHNGWALNDTLDEAADAIEKLSRKYTEERNVAVELTGELASKPRWISVAEQLPEDTCNVLVTDGENVGMGWLDYYTRKDTGAVERDWFVPNTPVEENKITHWMPLPEPPKEEPQIISAVDCKDCRYYPPSSLNGKPCTQCDMGNPLMNCFSPKEETE